jgi:zinc finger protein
MNRRVIKSEHATIKIPECDFEIPPMTQKGKLTTIEGFVSVAKEQLENAFNEGIYDELPDESKEKIKSIIQKLDDVLNFKKMPFKFILDDPSGNSFIENPFAPQTDPYIKVSYYERTAEMAQSMGYMVQPEGDDDTQTQEKKLEFVENVHKELTEKSHKEFVNPSYYDKKKEFSVYKSTSEMSAHLLDFTKSIESNTNIKEEALRFPTDCYCCGAPGENFMCLCTIPYFKEIIIICFKCQHCGYKSTEVKGGGGISEKATKITLNISSEEDFNRDLFKSETAKIIIPELQFETDTGSMGSMYTTVEGVIEKLIQNINEIPFSHGDSNEDNSLAGFIQKLKNLVNERQQFTLIIDDSLSNSFISSPYFPEADPRLEKHEYERTWEQNEELGINDMKVENYGEDKEEGGQ